MPCLARGRADGRPVPLHEHYESRLRLLERYDPAGFAAYHLAEHPAPPLGLAPAPGIFLAAASGRAGSGWACASPALLAPPFWGTPAAVVAILSHSGELASPPTS